VSTWNDLSAGYTTFLWFINDDESLTSISKLLIEDPESVLYLSVASLWEIGIKTSLGKLKMRLPFTEFMDDQ
jgi:PIN domain nuclease of toxin-antitoxin system